MMLSDTGKKGIIFPAAFLLLFFILLPGIANCQVSILDTILTFRSGTVKTGNALNIISKETGYYFTYDSRIIDAERKTDLTFSKMRLHDILDSLLKNDLLTYSVIDRYIIISLSQQSVNKIDTLATTNDRYITGTITDEDTGQPLSFATIAFNNLGKGTVTNSNGEFGININEDCIDDTVSVSYLGYIRREIPVRSFVGNQFKITMKREFISIPEIIIRTRNPLEIINKSLKSIPDNFGTTPALLTGFYREGVSKKTELQNYSEAILRIYKSSYTGFLLGDQIKVLKSRKIENTNRKDTLAVRLKAGLSTSLELDGIKHLYDFIEPGSEKVYIYRITDIVSFDDDDAYAVEFEQREGVDLPLFRGTFYINTDDFALLQADFELNPKHIEKIKDSFISDATRGFSTWPVSVKYSVSYRKLNDRYFLSHVRGDLLFLSKQKRKLFNTQFHVFFELAITDIELKNVTRFEREELAPVHSVFTRTIRAYDAAFWENQDFLKPEENLLKALENMKVKLREFSE